MPIADIINYVWPFFSVFFEKNKYSCCVVVCDKRTTWNPTVIKSVTYIAVIIEPTIHLYSTIGKIIEFREQ